MAKLQVRKQLCESGRETVEVPFEKNSKVILEYLSKITDLTLYECGGILSSRLNVAACARMQLAKRKECMCCKDKITERFLKNIIQQKEQKGKSIVFYIKFK
ncbi:MAG TPA: hypothetical protein ENF38_00115 [Candidatus Aenigmarchaeota archaeon]|nr:hypothetical protein [Candidatus Aenigmarchaeota archaeon]